VDIMSAATDVSFFMSGGLQTRNTALNSGGSTALFNYGAVANGTDFTIQDVAFVDNLGHWEGGALGFGLYGGGVASADIGVSRCTFTGNIARANGGAVWTNFDADVVVRPGSGDVTSLATCPPSDFR
jgi:hypothetical protein